MSLLEAERLHREVEARTRAARIMALRSWSRLPRSGDWLAAWATELQTVVPVVAAAQWSVARAADERTVRSLQSAGWRGETINRLDPLSLVGWMEPDSLPYIVPLYLALRSAPVAAATATTGAASTRLAAGSKMLDSLVQSAVSHAGRMAVQVGAHGRTKTKLAFFEPGSCCQRCAVLVGKTAGMHENFKRHPRCDGQVVEYPEAGRNPVPPLDEADVTDLTIAQRKAIADGADMNQVINAQRRGGLSADRMTTSVGGRNRLSPRGIYALAGDDREEARRLLVEHRYLLGSP